MAGLSLGPLIKLRNIHQNLTVGRNLNLGPVHGTRRRPFKVDAFAVVSAAVARTFELVLRRLPVGRAAQVSAARVDHENAVGRAVHPDAIFLLKLCVDSQAEVRGIADLERSSRLEQCARQEEAEEGDEPRRHEGRECGPGKAPARLIDLVVVGADRGHARGRCRSRSSDRRRADVGVRTLRHDATVAAAEGGPAAGRAAAAAGLATAAATGAAAARRFCAGSPSSAATSASVSAGKLLRPRRACSAAMVDLLHFFPSATHLATSALMGPLAAFAAGAAAAGSRCSALPQEARWPPLVHPAGQTSPHCSAQANLCVHGAPVRRRWWTCSTCFLAQPTWRLLR